MLVSGTDENFTSCIPHVVVTQLLRNNLRNIFAAQDEIELIFNQAYTTPNFFTRRLRGQTILEHNDYTGVSALTTSMNNVKSIGNEIL